MANHRSIAPWHMRPGRQPLPGESLDGYIAHRAAEESIPTTLVVTSLGGAIFGHRRSLTLTGEGIEEVADCLCAPAADLASRTYPLEADGHRRAFFGVPLDRTILDIETRRFSPTSLAASPHHRALWSIRVLPFCEESWEMLTDRCPAADCGAVQRWHRANGIDRCDQCARPLSRAEADEVPKALRRPLRSLIGLIHHDPARRLLSLGRLPAELQLLGPGPVMELACALAGLVNPSLRANRHKRLIRKGVDANALSAAMAEAWHLLEGWPSAVEELLAARLARRPGRFGDGNGDASTDFLGLPSSTRLPEGVSTLISAMRRRLEGNRKAGFDLKEAAVATGLPVTRLADLRRQGLVPSIFHLDGDRPHPLLDRRAVNSLSEALRSSLPIHKAAAQLGVSYHGIEQMLCLGLLEPVRVLATRHETEVIQVSAISLRQFGERLRRHAVPFEPNMTPLKTVVRRRPGLKPWGPAMERLASGKARFAIEGAGPLAATIMVGERVAAELHELSFHKSAHEGFDFATMMSKSDAAEALNLHWRSAATLLASWPSAHGTDRTVPLCEVERLSVR
jgi:hypothetical protein